MYRWLRYFGRFSGKQYCAIIGSTTLITMQCSNIVDEKRKTKKLSTFNGNDDDDDDDIVIDRKWNVQLNHKPTKRELRFLQFASVEYDDVIYMTPRDFIDSIILDVPRERVYRRVLSKETVNKGLARIPSFHKASRSLFRELDHYGIISYSDYLFLLTILTKSRRALRIAFVLFDRDDNNKIEKDEFLLIRALISIPRSSRSLEEARESCSITTPDLNYLMKKLGLQTRPKGEIVYEKSDEEVKLQDTTLLRYLFGNHGNELRSFEEIEKFRDNLQKEIIELEFNEYSHGRSEISPVDFARLVLRYSTIRKADYDKYIERVRERSTIDDRGVTFAEYESFSLFLNNLKEFKGAIRLYASANIPVSQTEFIRAIQASTGYILDENLVNLLFRIFDTNSDNRLSYSEFISVMNDRVHRGFKVVATTFGWKKFKRCVHEELSGF